MIIDGLIKQIFAKKSMLCVGLDSSMDLLPKGIPKNEAGLLAFNKAIIEATKDYCVSYKINTAFYEVLGAKGWKVIERTLAEIPATHFTIADAKRGDIGNTSKQYAKTFFETFAFDAVTVAPYMGEDSIRPFLEYQNKCTIVLGLTSNKGAADFELLKAQSRYIYEYVLEKTSRWGNPKQLMFVIGATQVAALKKIREKYPEYFFLIPGIGAQGGDLSEVCQFGMNADGGLLINASRAILYADASKKFADAAQSIAASYQQKMEEFF